MAKAGRIVLAVVAGAAAWAVLWIGGNGAAQSALPQLVVAGQPLTHPGVLLGFIVYSVLLSVLAGYITGAAAGAHLKLAVKLLAVLQLIFGIIAETSYWSLAPVWYHLVFLALIIPMTVYGGSVRARGRAASAALARA